MTIGKRTTKHTVARVSAAKSSRKKEPPAAASSETKVAAPSNSGSSDAPAELLDFDEDGERSQEGGATMSDPKLTPEQVGESLVKAQKDALAALEGDTKLDPAEKQAEITRAKQILEAIATLAQASPELTDDEKIELYKMQRRIDAGLGVVATITGALFATHKVLTNTDFQSALSNLPASAKASMTNSLTKVIEKLDPIFKGFAEFQKPELQADTFNLLDAGVNLGYALVNLAEPEQQEPALKLADNIAIVMGLVKKAAPLVLACINMIGCCLAALAKGAADPGAQLSEASRDIGSKLHEALKVKTAIREAGIKQNVLDGKKLYEAQQAKLLPA